MDRMTLQGISVNGAAEFVELTDAEAWALAELCKRITYNECRANAVSEDEAYQMIYATSKVRDLLARVGYEVR